jgi:hypothetical protein
MENYKLTINRFGGEPTCIIRLSDGAAISISLENKDYQAYLKWVAEGNTPLPADE